MMVLYKYQGCEDFNLSPAQHSSHTFSNNQVLAMLSQFITFLALTGCAAAAPNPRAAKCTSYTIINTRGTGEIQGPSAGFRTMNSQITSQLPGGKIYNTVYLAGYDQNSAQGTQDIIREVNSVLASNPSECFILEGYSQGAAATVNALPQLTGSAGDAVKGVFLIGDPLHKSGLACNVDNNGGTTTKNVNGLEAFGGGGIPQNWISRTLDVCIFVSSHQTWDLGLFANVVRAMESVIRRMGLVSMLSTFSIRLMRRLRNLEQLLLSSS